MKMYIVHMVECSDGKYYTGITNDINRRIEEHNFGVDSTAFTYKRRPVKLLFTAEFTIATLAIAFEKQLKGWSRKKKEALINNNYTALKELAECKNITHYKNLEK